MKINKNEITTWMKTQGYPLEMRVARIFSDNEFTTAISEYYNDVDGKKKREIDITAKLWSESSIPVMLNISLNIECKKISKPWILLKGKEKGVFYEPFDISATRLMKNILFRLMQEPSRNGIIRQLPINQQISHYYGITEFDGTGNEKPFKTMCSCSKSVIDEIDRTEAWESSHKNSSYHAIRIVYPVIILEGQLFEYKYEKTDEITNEINLGAIHWKYYQRDFSIIDVLFCTENGIQELINIVNNTMTSIDGLIQGNKEIIEDEVRKEAAQQCA